MQRRTPSGQGPARRTGGIGRAGVRGAAGRGAGRATAREPGLRAEPRRASASARLGAGRAGDAARSANRPALARRGASGAAATRTTAPRPRRMTGRATILLVILTALALGYTYPVRVYLDQESDIARIQAAQQGQRSRIEGLQEEVVKWQDDEYVRIQARRRFYYVEPGEVPLLVWDSETGPADRQARASDSDTDGDPWYDTLWSSIEAADREPRR